jgi:ribonuclease HI
MKLYCDGACKGNNRLDVAKRVMRIVVTDEDGVVLVERSLKRGTNNLAELWAIVEAMLFVRDCELPGPKEADVCLDSQTAIAWANGRVSKTVKNYSGVMDLLSAMRALQKRVALKLTWVPRDENKAGHYIEENYES